MARTIEIGVDDVVVRLSGMTAFAALKRELRIPLRGITSVVAGRYERDGLRVGGTSIPFTDIREGRFRRRGVRAFLSFDDRDRVVTLALDRSSAGVPYDVVALGADDPEALAHEIEARLAPG